MIHDARKPWSYRGWLMWYRQQCEGHPQVAPRWEYWTRIMLAKKILDDPIPQIKFSDHASDRSEGYKMLDRCMNVLDRYSSAPTSYMMQWLKFGLGISKESPEIEHDLQEKLYRTFNLEPWLLEPYDYIGLWISEHKGRWNPSAFFPTPHNVCEMMLRMTMGDGDHRFETVNDPAVGTGRFLLHASNYSLRLSGIDIDRTVLDGCLVNGAIYAPWLVRPFPEAWFEKGKSDDHKHESKRGNQDRPEQPLPGNSRRVHHGGDSVPTRQGKRSAARLAGRVRVHDPVKA